jgi:hypothetical protein
MRYNYNDGGRRDAGYKGERGDCVTRAIAIATGTSYRQVYRELTELTKSMTGGLDTSVANGCSDEVAHRYLIDLGWSVVLTPKTYLKDAPRDQRILVSLTERHNVAVINGTVHDSWDSRVSRRTKCKSPKMAGYYRAPSS